MVTSAAAAAAAAAASFSSGPSHCYLCHAEASGCSTSYSATSTWMKSPLGSYGFSDHFGIRFSGAMHWSPVRRDICLLKVSVAADYSDSVPDSSNYMHDLGYHPLEELKVHKRVRETKLSPAEIARTTVEANNSALLVFPSEVHCEPHPHVSWEDYQYVIDDCGDIFFEIFDDENILEDRGASNPVNVLIGMDIQAYGDRRLTTAKYDSSDPYTSYDIPFEDDYFEVEDMQVSDSQVDWGMPLDDNGVVGVHPMYFSKCLAKAVSIEYAKKMDRPSNGVFIMGFLRPAFMDEESYIRGLFNDEIIEGFTSDSKDGDVWDFTAWRDGNRTSLRFYKLEIMKMELFSVYSIQYEIGLRDFQEAEPDILVHLMPSIVQRFSEKVTICNSALRALCKKRGLYVEGANLIGVDSLGLDVRVFSGVEVQTHRFPFKVRATSESTAEKQIYQLLFPRARRKKLLSHGDGLLKDL